MRRLACALLTTSTIACNSARDLDYPIALHGIASNGGNASSLLGKRLDDEEMVLDSPLTVEELSRRSSNSRNEASSFGFNIEANQLVSNDLGAKLGLGTSSVARLTGLTVVAASDYRLRDSTCVAWNDGQDKVARDVIVWCLVAKGVTLASRLEADGDVAAPGAGEAAISAALNLSQTGTDLVVRIRTRDIALRFRGQREGRIVLDSRLPADGRFLALAFLKRRQQVEQNRQVSFEGIPTTCRVSYSGKYDFEEVGPYQKDGYTYGIPGPHGFLLLEQPSAWSGVITYQFFTIDYDGDDLYVKQFVYDLVVE